MGTAALPDVGTQEAWERHRRKMRTQEEVARIRRLLNAGPVWGKLKRQGGETRVEVGDIREGVRLA